MGETYDPKLATGNFIPNLDDDDADAPWSAARQRIHDMRTRISLQRDPGELALLQPGAREKVRAALRDAKAALEVNDPRPRLDKFSEPVSRRYQYSLRLPPPPKTTASGLSKNTISSLQQLGLDPSDPFPSRGTLRKVLDLYRHVRWSPDRDANIAILEDAIGWKRTRRSHHQVLMDQMTGATPEPEPFRRGRRRRRDRAVDAG
jgi:hypothetical protein